MGIIKSLFGNNGKDVKVTESEVLKSSISDDDGTSDVVTLPINGRQFKWTSKGLAETDTVGGTETDCPYYVRNGGRKE
jgi:hypothetical protein